MQHIRSKDIYYLLRDSLKLYDRRPMVHGCRTAYIVYKMLECQGGLEKFELADIVFLATFHDIGSYRTDDIEQMLANETKNFSRHSLYGHLFLSHLSLLGAATEIIQHHHDDYAAMAETGFGELELLSYISLAEAIELYGTSLGPKFDLATFGKKLGNRYSPAAFELFCRADKEYGIFEKLGSRAFSDEIRGLMEYFILTNAEKEKLVRMLMYTVGMRSEAALRNNVACVALCDKMGQVLRLNDGQRKNLRYAAYLHDIGYLAFDGEWLDKTAKLSTAQMEKLAYHTVLMEQLLKDKMRREVIVIAAAHHERIDGKGYPRKLTEKQMNLPQLVLQFCDGICEAMVAPIDKDRVLELVKKQTDNGNFSDAVAKAFADKFDEIAASVEEQSGKMLAGWVQAEEKYGQVFQS